MRLNTLHIIITIIAICTIGCTKTGKLSYGTPIADTNPTPITTQTVNGFPTHIKTYYTITAKYVRQPINSDIYNNTSPEYLNNFNINSLCKENFNLINEKQIFTISISENKPEKNNALHSLPIFQIDISKGSNNNCDILLDKIDIIKNIKLTSKNENKTIYYAGSTVNEKDIPFDLLKAFSNDILSITRNPNILPEATISNISKYVNDRLKFSFNERRYIELIDRESGELHSIKHYIPVILTTKDEISNTIGYIEIYTTTINSLITGDKSTPNFASISKNNLYESELPQKNELQNIIKQFNEADYPLSSSSIIVQKAQEFGLNEFDTAAILYLAFNNKDLFKKRIATPNTEFERYVPIMISTGINIEQLSNCKYAFMSEIKEKLSTSLREECQKLLARKINDTHSLHQQAFETLIRNGINKTDALLAIASSMDLRCKNIPNYTYSPTITNNTPQEMWDSENYLNTPPTEIDEGDVEKIFLTIAGAMKSSNSTSARQDLSTIIHEDTILNDNIFLFNGENSKIEHLVQYKVKHYGGYIALDKPIKQPDGRTTTASSILNKPSGTRQYTSIALLEEGSSTKAIFITITPNWSSSRNEYYISHIEIDLANDEKLQLLEPELKGSKLWGKNPQADSN